MWNGRGAVELWTYSDGGKHILELVDESDECRVIDVDTDQHDQYCKRGWAITHDLRIACRCGRHDWRKGYGFTVTQRKIQ